MMKRDCSDPVVFAGGERVIERHEATVELHIPHDVALSQLQPALAGLVGNRGEASDCDARSYPVGTKVVA